MQIFPVNFTVAFLLLVNNRQMESSIILYFVNLKLSLLYRRTSTDPVFYVFIRLEEIPWKLD